MYVCLCTGVCDSEIKQLVREGVASVAEVMQCTGAGSRCGSCVPEIARLVEEKAEPSSLPRRMLKVVRPGAAA